MIVEILARGNSALLVNPATGVGVFLSEQGSDWLWAAVAIFLAAFLGMLFFSFAFPENKRVFLYTFTVALLVGATSYYGQASNLGWSAVLDHVQDDGTTVTRQLFYARYVYWTVSFPAVALALGLLAGVSWTTIVCNLCLSWIWVLSFLAGAYTATVYKWGFFAFGSLCWLVLAMSTLNESREEAARRGIAGDYMLLSAWANLVWVLYPVAWGLADGAHVLGVTQSAVFFGVLDVLLVPVESFAFVAVGRRWDWERLELAVSEYRGEGRGRLEEAAEKQTTGGQGVVEEGH